ncbi:MAG: hypothetical protein ACKOW1_03640 [Novosphingobium sp.]
MPDENLLAILRRSGGLVAVSRQLEIAPAMAAAAVTALMPMVRGGFRRRIETADGVNSGLAELFGRIEALGGGALAGMVLHGQAIAPGLDQAVLAEIFGSEACIRMVVDHVAADHALDRDVVRGALPIVVMLIGGYILARAGRMTAEQRRAELGPLFDLAAETNPLDALA